MSVDQVRRVLPRAVVVLDFDGTLSPIVARPVDARPLAGFEEVLAELVPRVHRLAIVTGRPASFVRERLDVDGIDVVGLYGLGGAQPLDPALLAAVREAASAEAGAFVEDKGMTVALHVRGTEDPDAALRRLRPVVTSIATAAGLTVMEGKRVLEVAPAGGGKGDAIRAMAEGAAAILVAGDDVADIDAFEALDGLDAVVCRVAVLGPETPDRLRARADVTVDGPEGLLVLLRSLV